MTTGAFGNTLGGKFTMDDLANELRKNPVFLEELSSQLQSEDKESFKGSDGPVLLQKSYEDYTEEYIEFTYKNPTIFHVVSSFSKDLEANGFKYLSEKDSWDNVKPGKYYTSRNGSSLVAFVVGEKWTADKGVGALGAHIDALTAYLKPNSTKSKVDGYELLGVANYGGTLGDLWFDRDLGVGGRVVYKDHASGKTTSKLVDSTPHPIAHIPSLAPHFGAPAIGPFNKETQAVPVVGYSSEEEQPATSLEKKSPLYGKHSLKLLRYISKLSGVAVEDIVTVDLQLYDVQKGSFGGLDNEFLFAPRIDDRICSFSGIKSLIEADGDKLLASDNFSLVAVYDNEEVGSLSRAGARGGILESVVSRVLSSDYYAKENKNVEGQLRVVWGNTIVLLVDVSHLLNPNFVNVYLEHHKPVPNTGLAIALDSNGHFATDSTGVALVEEIARKNKDTLQYFQIRNDSRSGGTIGPHISSSTGARTIDIGIAQLSMHSIRATTGSKDVGLAIKFFKGFYEKWRKTYDTYDDL